MDRRFSGALSRAVSVALFHFVVATARVANAEPNDDAALDLAKKAIEADYLGTKFAEAEKKLKQALTLCGPKSCSNKVVARLHRDLGVVYAGGMSKIEEGKAEFVAALKADPEITLDPDLTSEEIETVFKDAKAAAGIGGGGNPESPPPNPTPNPGPVAPAPAQGDLVHTPPPEQTVMTPVPIYTELPDGVEATKVVLQYRPFGASAWKTLEMPKVTQGYGVEVPCLDVGSVTGQLKYFIQAFDKDNNVVAFAGTRKDPLNVAIKLQIEGASPSLPGQAPPAKCSEAADCPPGLLGCPKPGEEKTCPEGEPCDKPPEAPSVARKNWVTLGLQQDFLGLSGTTGTCSGGNEYSCFSGDDFYEAIPYDKSGGEVAGGLAVATTRIFIGYERVFGKNFTAGLRAGFVFGGGPQAPGGAAFVPVHAEARAAYWFGADPFAGTGLRPFLTLGGGLAQVDASVKVTVYNTEQDFIADKRLVLDAWKKSGLVFIAAGGGAMYAIRPNTGPVAEVRVMQLFGASGTTLGATLGYSHGF
ncbi:hypothetical protein [Polyangium jinanense]|uniref:Tetratricopeptide repeat protein n=1 Tax=Polyangium jinanense TaxID=2829994 RepID=A0A9X3XCY0_9BACT|nr:hypothetical protein [Polyangium jinanense]MDC3957087.1 hypothetical protein [Polyangium jinanense]MDC3987040.1 hypothetical protein [Polyangium jinanense]